jgi:hypothetical protein
MNNTLQKSLLVVLSLGLVSGAAWADRGRIYFGFNAGLPWWPYHPYALYPPQTLVIERPAPAPTVYIQQAPMPPVAAEPVQTKEGGYWYYCAAQRNYYPYIKRCPGGWEKLSPEPADLR